MGKLRVFLRKQAEKALTNRKAIDYYGKQTDAM